MKRDRLKKCELLLKKQLEKLISEARDMITGMTDVKESPPDPTDLATVESDRDFLLRIRDRERKLIIKIREALKRIEDGTFGKCEICGEDISEDRLLARPVATQCIECKTEMEVEERRMRKE